MPGPLGRFARLTPVAGGDLNDAFRAERDDGSVVFVKSSEHAAPGAFAAEAAGLRWLAEADGAPAVAVPLEWDDRCLVLEWIERGAPAADAGEQLGRGLAAVHQAGADGFGAPDVGTTLLGPLSLPSADVPTWAEFVAQCRWLPLAEQASLPAGSSTALDRLIGRLPELLGAEEPPARLHGDLWSGNVMHRADGAPVLIDPAAHGGHRETDLAMLCLFGRPGPGFLPAYEEVSPLADGYAERVALHQLTPLLVHAALFGGGYGASARRVIDSYL